MQLFHSFLKSFYSPAHYESVALDGKGIGLSYLFGLAALLFTIGVGVGLYYIEGNVQGFITLLELNMASHFPSITFGSVNSILFILLSLIIVIFNLSLLLLNYAVTVAVLSQLLDYALNTELDFAQLLRITVYAQVPAFLFFVAILMFAQHLAADPGILMIIFMWLFTHGLYMTFAIASTRSGVN